VLGGTFAAMLVGSFAGLFTGARDRAALRRAGSGEPMRDGHLEAASGPIHPLDAPLEAPFTGRPCVAYEYDVKKHVETTDREEGTARSEYAGVALAPCAIGTVRGSVRVLGWALLDQFQAAGDASIDRARGAAYLKNTPLEPLGLTGILSAFGELLADDDGSIRKDFQIGDGTVALDRCRIEEKIVPVGQVVTLLGRWSNDAQGFAPRGGALINRLFPADLETTKRHVRKDTKSTFFTGLFFFVALHAILVPMYFLAPTPGVTGPDPVSVWDERDCDRQKTHLAAGANPNEPGRDGLTPLMNAARQGEPACVQNLIAAGARLEDADKDGNTALSQAITAGRDDNIAILQKAGAKDFRVTSASGKAVTEASGPFEAVKDYVAAVHAGDFQKMARLYIGASVALMEERRDDLKFWQSMRPQSPLLVEGWMTEEEATLTIRGATASGDHRISYHLEDSADGWRIKKEWFPDLR